MKLLLCKKLFDSDKLKDIIRNRFSEHALDIVLDHGVYYFGFYVTSSEAASLIKETVRDFMNGLILSAIDHIDLPPKEKKFDPTKPVRRRDGREVRIICTDSGHKNLDGTPEPIISLYRVGIEDYDVCFHCEDGRYVDGENNDEDLINVEE